MTKIREKSETIKIEIFSILGRGNYGEQHTDKLDANCGALRRYRTMLPVRVHSHESYL